MAYYDAVNWSACDAHLRAMWNDGVSTAQIAEAINARVPFQLRNRDVTKNAVIGRAHRLSLPARRSPIAR